MNSVGAAPGGLAGLIMPASSGSPLVASTKRWNCDASSKGPSQVCRRGRDGRGGGEAAGVSHCVSGKVREARGVRAAGASSEE